MYDCLVPPAIPCTWLFLLDTFAGRFEDARVVPPTAVGKVGLIRETADGRAVPELLVGERGFEDCKRRTEWSVLSSSVDVLGRNNFLTGVVEIIDMQCLDLVDRRQLLGRDGPSAHRGGRQMRRLIVAGAAIPILLRRQCAGVVGWHASS